MPHKPLQRADRMLISNLFVPMSLKRQKLHSSKIRNTTCLFSNIRFSVKSKSEHNTINRSKYFSKHNLQSLYKDQKKKWIKKIISQIILEYDWIKRLYWKGHLVNIKNVYCNM